MPLNAVLNGRGEVALFGDRGSFAIEVGRDVWPDSPPNQTWGHMCVWVDGVALGEIEEKHCGLDQTRSELVRLAQGLDSQWASEFSGLTHRELWRFLDGVLYGYDLDVEVPDSRTTEECRRDSERWGRFDFLTNWGEQFDGVKAFLICPPGGSVRILFRAHTGALGTSSDLSHKAFQGAVHDFNAWFEAQPE